MDIVHLMITGRFAGTQRHVTELANYQSSETGGGHRVNVILSRSAQQPDGSAQHFHDDVGKYFVSDFKVLAWFQARRHLSKLNPDVAHAHLSAGCRAIAPMTSDKMLRVATLHAGYKPRQHEKLDALVAITPSQLDSVPDELRARSVHINNWTQSTPVPAGVRQARRAELDVAESHFVIGALGRLEPHKGMDRLIKAFMRADMPDARLVIVGSGSAERSLRALSAEDPRIVLPGFSDEPQTWLAAFDVFVNAAEYEPFGLTFLEAMVAGLPVIATETNGARHLAPHFGIPLVPVDDEQALRMALELAYEQRPARRNYDLQAFRLSECARELETFYAASRAAR